MNNNKLLELDVIYVNYFSYEDLIYSLKLNQISEINP